MSFRIKLMRVRLKAGQSSWIFHICIFYREYSSSPFSALTITQNLLTFEPVNGYCMFYLFTHNNFMCVELYLESEFLSLTITHFNRLKTSRRCLVTHLLCDCVTCKKNELDRCFRNPVIITAQTNSIQTRMASYRSTRSIEAVFRLDEFNWYTLTLH